jgi:hypothetical protein
LQGALPSAAKEEITMSVTRRQFLLSTAGAAAGAIIPSFYFRALEFFEQHGEPLLVAPAHATQDLCLLDVCGESTQLCLGDPYAEPPEMTYREFLTRYHPDTFDNFEEDWCISPAELDTEIDFDYVLDEWSLRDSPAAHAYRLLQSLDLGPALKGRNAKGGINFVEDSNMVSYWRYASPENEVSLSLLQQRLTDLGTGIRVVTGFAV